MNMRLIKQNKKKAKLKLLIMIMIIFVWSGAVYCENNSETNSSSIRPKQNVKQKSLTENETKAAKSNKSFNNRKVDFVPSEKIKADSAVPFPADI